MHVDLILEWIKYQALIITPLIPHFSEHIWQNLLNQKTSVQNERYPEVDEVDTPLLDALQYIRQSVKTMRDAELALAKRKKGGKGPAQPGAFDPLAKKGLKVYTAKSYPQWQEQGVEIAKECWNENEKKFELKPSFAAQGANCRRPFVNKPGKSASFVISIIRRIRQLVANSLPGISAR